MKTNIFKILFLLLLLISSCKSHKELTNTDTNTVVPGCAIQYTTFSAPKAVFTFVQGGNAMDVSGSVKIKKDSIVILSMQPFLGMEVARVAVTAEEFLVIDRFNKRYASIPMAEVKSQLGMDINFSILQSILTNSLFAVDKQGQAFVSDFKEVNVGSLKLLQRTTDKIIQEFSVDSVYSISSASIYANGEPYSLKWSYSMFDEIQQNRRFPMQLKFIAGDGRRSQQLDVKYSKIEIDKSTNFDNNIPAGYKKVSFEEMLSILK